MRCEVEEFGEREGKTGWEGTATTSVAITWSDCSSGGSDGKQWSGSDRGSARFSAASHSASDSESKTKYIPNHSSWNS
nr:hypothetical protein CFP56_21669 [Quercus suber]